MTDIAELNTGSEYNSPLKTLRECAVLMNGWL